MRAYSLVTLVAASLCGIVSAASAQNATTISFDSGAYTLYSSMVQNNSTILSAGDPNISGDGDVLRLGYYTDATASNPFAGTFVPLSGEGAANTDFIHTSIGDDASNGSGAGPGTFALSLSFVSGSPTSGQNLPASSHLLAIQFFNGSTMANSTMYNAASAPSWLFAAASYPAAPVALSLDDAGVTFLGSSDFTSVPVPEPQSLTLIALGMAIGGSAIWARRKGRSAIPLA